MTKLTGMSAFKTWIAEGIILHTVC